MNISCSRSLSSSWLRSTTPALRAVPRLAACPSTWLEGPAPWLEGPAPWLDRLQLGAPCGLAPGWRLEEQTGCDLGCVLECSLEGMAWCVLRSSCGAGDAALPAKGLADPSPAGALALTLLHYALP
jgi:hypothetical protein